MVHMHNVDLLAILALQFPPCSQDSRRSHAGSFSALYGDLFLIKYFSRRCCFRCICFRFPHTFRAQC
jgi:hypothetical protein